MSQTGEVQGIPFDRCRLLQAAALLMRDAIGRLWPQAKLTVGPPLSKPFPGFYCEMDLDHQLTAEDVSKISAAMDQLRSEDRLGSREAPAQDDRRRLHFKLFNSSGAYLWRDPAREQIQRLCGTAWPTRMELRRDIARHDGAAERDYRKIGGLLKLFQCRGESPGALFWLPQGISVQRILSQKLRGLILKNGYKEVTGDPALLYQGTKRNQMELPLRFFGPLGLQPGDGASKPIFQAREDYQDSHLFLKQDQVEEEITAVMGFVRRVHAAFEIELCARLNISDRAQATGDWLTDIFKRNGMAYEVNRDPTATCGPEIDFMTPNAFGVFERPGAAIQLDFEVAERLDLRYVEADKAEKRPVVLHHTLHGSCERLLQAVLERTAGKLPLWLAPVQVKVLTISRRFTGHGKRIQEALLSAGIRCELDDRDEKIAFKARGAALEKVPYVLEVGTKEKESGRVSVRSREQPDENELLPLEAFVSRVTREAEMSF